MGEISSCPLIKEGMFPVPTEERGLKMDVTPDG